MSRTVSDSRGGVSLPGFDHLLAGGQIAGARPYQEDDFRVTAFPDRDPDGCDMLMVLADGMGGHQGGAEASRLAVSTAVESFRQATGGVAARLRASLDAANAAVGRYAADPRYAGMGCTFVACVVTEDEMAHWISVGDSPLWCVRVGTEGDASRMDRLNADHSMRPVLENLVQLGRMTPEEAATGGATQLRSAVTGEALKLVDSGSPPVRLSAGDRIVLASDGLETLPGEEVLRLGGRNRAAAATVSDLLEAVETIGKPSQDNATVIVYRHLAGATLRRRFELLTAPTRPIGRPRRRSRWFGAGRQEPAP